jgi:hypothetical protein
MRKERQWPEVFVEMEFLKRTDIINKVLSVDMQDTQEEIDIVKDYYNNFLLDGHETYLEYLNEEIGYFLLSRNVKEVKNPFGSMVK